LSKGLDADADDIALVSLVRSMTWRELETESAALAGGYGRIGLRQGDRIASLMPNRIDLGRGHRGEYRCGRSFLRDRRL
jgi:long-chain acyl-CoA synthetase